MNTSLPLRTFVTVSLLLMAAACSRYEEPSAPADTAPPETAPSPVESTPPPADIPALMGTAWSAEFIQGKGETGNKESTLEFLPEGRVAGRAGCNRYGGPVEVSGSKVKFGDLMATKMACDLLEQEQKFLAALAETRGYTVETGKLLLRDESGAVLARLATTTAAAP